MKKALVMSVIWIALAMFFNIGIYFSKGSQDALNFFTGYLIEYFLSVDNLFVFVLIFTHFSVPSAYVHKILFYGVVGAIVMRAVFILCGVALIQQFHWILYLFGAFLMLTGIKLFLKKETSINENESLILKFFYRFFPFTKDYHGDKFFIRSNGKYLATPLFVVLLMIETTDLIFAMDSIPAVMGITLDPFIIYTSNIFAVLGLRSLYFVLSHSMGSFYYLQHGLGMLLVFIGAKMLLAPFVLVPISVTLILVIGVIVGSIVLSMNLSQ